MNVICPLVVLFSELRVCSCVLCDLFRIPTFNLLLSVCNTGSSINLLCILNEFLSG